MTKRIEIDGRPYWVLPVVSGADGEGGSGEGGSGGEGGQGGSGQSGSGSNMDPEGEGGKGGEGGGGEGEGAKPDPTKPVTFADFERIQAERDQKMFDRLADSSGKQIKNALKEALGDKKPAGDKGGQGQGDGKGGEGAKAGPSEEDIARAEADRKRLVRDSRAATRDVLSETVKFMGNFEREDAMHDASGLISGLVAAGEQDEEKIGQAVAKEVKERLEARRKFYEERVTANYKRKGLLVETPGQGTGGSAGAGGSANGPQQSAAFAAGRDRANAMFRPVDQKK